MLKKTLVAAAGLWLVTVAGSSFAEDQWERNDNDAATLNMLRHGSIQRGHDLECKLPPANATCCPEEYADHDWAAVSLEQYHSYEARVTSGEVVWDTSGAPIFDLVDASGTVLVHGESELGARGVVVRWLQQAAPGSATFLRAVGVADQKADIYDIEFLDTTLFVPRWFNSEPQLETTSFLIQNTTTRTVNGKINLFLGTGGLVTTPVAFVVAPRGVVVFHTQTVPEARNAAGTATVTHDGGWGGLVGQAVRIQTGNGWAFYTPMEVRPR